jgi:hypothetical protein
MKMETLKPDDLLFQSLTAFFIDVGNQFQIPQGVLNRNIAYLKVRYINEGVGFLTKTLPKLGKALDKSLLEGKFTCPSDFKSDRQSLPLCLTGLIERVFSKGDGTLLCTACPNAVSAIRQLTFQFYKLEIPYTKEQEDESISNFVAVDEELTHCDTVTPEITSLLYDASRIIYSVFRNFDPLDIIPRPGPGQCAERTPHYNRYEPGTVYRRIHMVYPTYRYYYIGSRDHLLDRAKRYRDLPRAMDGISKLALVPKDSRGPRIICMEPHEYMWHQQGLGRAMMDWIQKHYLTRGQVNFVDQTVNGKLSLESSLSGKYATLDMKEASDRISKNMIDYLFQDVPSLRDALLALSTGHIELPSGQHIRQNKFAPMGSALCFPVMSIVHFALALAAISAAKPGSPLKALAKTIFVYGDDLIVKTEHVGDLFEAFPTYGLKFNRDKSCYTGQFRESCGVDAFKGFDVTPTRVKIHTFPRRDPSAIQKHVAIVNNFRKKGYINMARVWRLATEKAYGKFPYVSEKSAAVGWIVPSDRVYLDNISKLKYDRKLQTWMLRCRVLVTRPLCSMNGGWEQLMRAQVHCVASESTSLYGRDQTNIVWKRIPLSAL